MTSCPSFVGRPRRVTRVKCHSVPRSGSRPDNNRLSTTRPIVPAPLRSYPSGRLGWGLLERSGAHRMIGNKEKRNQVIAQAERIFKVSYPPSSPQACKA